MEPEGIEPFTHRVVDAGPPALTVEPGDDDVIVKREYLDELRKRPREVILNFDRDGELHDISTLPSLDRVDTVSSVLDVVVVTADGARWHAHAKGQIELDVRNGT